MFVRFGVKAKRFKEDGRNTEALGTLEKIVCLVILAIASDAGVAASDNESI